MITNFGTPSGTVFVSPLFLKKSRVLNFDKSFFKMGRTQKMLLLKL